MQSEKGESKDCDLINISGDFLSFCRSKKRELNASRANRLRTIVYCLSLQFVFRIARDARSVNYNPIKATKRRDRLPPLRVAIHQTAEDERNRRRGQYRDTSGRAFSLSIPFRPENGRRALSRNDKIKGTRHRRQ